MQCVSCHRTSEFWIHCLWNDGNIWVIRIMVSKISAENHRNRDHVTLIHVTAIPVCVLVDIDGPLAMA